MAGTDHVQSFPSDIFPHYSISVALFDNLINVDDLKSQIVAGNIDAALLSPKMICGVFQILAAATKAIASETRGKLKTRSINSEIIFNLAPSNNISDSLRKFGVSPDDCAAVAVTINDFDGLKMQNVVSCIDAEMKPLDQLLRYTEEDRIQKVYKISDAELHSGTLFDSVVTRIAVKEFAT